MEHQWARAWVESRLGPVRVEVHRDRSWGVLWRVHAADGEYWCKLPSPADGAEVRLRRVLEAHAPEWVLPLIAADDVHGWQLTVDQGHTLGALTGETHPEVAVTLARIQRAVPLDSLDHVGLPCFSPQEAAQRLEEHGAWLTELPASHGAHLPVRELRAAIRRVDRVARRWEGTNPLLGVDHNDLHLGNVFPGPLLSDWGDAVVAHPFCALRRLAFDALTNGGPALLARTEEAYLTEWGEPSSLTDELEAAHAVTAPQRLWCWRRLGDLDAVHEYAEFVVPLVTEAGLGLSSLSTA